MKKEILVKANLMQKIVIWNVGDDVRSERLKEHIVMLDWVWNDSDYIRDIEDIANDSRLTQKASNKAEVKQ